MILFENDCVDRIVALNAVQGKKIECFSGEEQTPGGFAIAEDAVNADGVRAHVVEPRFVQGRCGSDAGMFLLCVGLWVPDEYRDEFVAWYEYEHAPILLECPMWIGCRFVEEPVDNGSQFFALHELLTRRALDSDERRRSRSTPWFGRLALTEWFDGPFDRRLYRRITTAKA